MNSVAIYGGLGNQMFQYAFYLALKQKGQKVKLSLSDFFYYHEHNGFNLNIAFQLRLDFPSNVIGSALVGLESIYKSRVASAILRRSVPWVKLFCYDEYREKKEFRYDPLVFDLNGRLFIGTWQSLAYLNGTENAIKNAFSFRILNDPVNSSLTEKITTSNSVSIHIRRGDYHFTNWEKSHHVIRSMNYYTRAMNHLTDRVSEPHYFVFSDDIEWAMRNLITTNCTFVNHNKGRNSYMDMYLMSICRHNIIANSTFSWWAAWLNAYKDKIVIMPEKWLNTCDSGDIFPQGWVKLPVD